jgi:hypothetical protein
MKEDIAYPVSDPACGAEFTALAAIGHDFREDRPGKICASTRDMRRG